MEEARQQDLFCIQCKLQFGKKIIFDLHLSLVHDKKVEIKTEATSNLTEPELDKDISKDRDGNGSYKCEICRTCFKLKGNLKKHVDAVHENKKPFKCGICDYSSSHKGHMTAHIKSVHEGNKPFICEICDKGFAQKDNMKNHVSAIHEENK